MEKGLVRMNTPQIEKVVAFDDMVLKAKFIDGTVKRYNANKLFDLKPQPIYNGKPMFEPLRNNPELFSGSFSTTRIISVPALGTSDVVPSCR